VCIYLRISFLPAVPCSSDYLSSVEHDRFVRDVLSQLGLDGETPSEGLVTDYFVDFKTCTFKTWKERCDGMTVNRNGYITVPEVRATCLCNNHCWQLAVDISPAASEPYERVFQMLKASHFSEVLLSGGHNVILLGEHGMGKTASVKVRKCASPVVCMACVGWSK